jgi:hypothetical protein
VDRSLTVPAEDEVLLLASLQRRRLGWWWLSVLAVSLVTMSACAGGLIADLSPTTSHRLHDPSGNAHHTVAVWTALYFAAALVASAATVRFDLRRVPRRLPFVVVLGSIGIVLLLIGRVALHGLTAGGDSATGGDGPEANDRGTPQRPGSLAATLFHPEELADVLGAAADPVPTGRRRCASTYRARQGPGTLTLAVQARPRRLDDGSFASGNALWCASGEWRLALAGIDREGRPLDRASLTELARRGAARLPSPDQIARYERETGLFVRKPRGLLNRTLAGVGIAPN